MKDIEGRNFKMLNGKKFKKEILEIRNCDFGFNKRDNKIMLCNTRLCGLCSFSQKNRKVYEPSCSVAKMKWLLSEYKEPIKLTKLEYEILKYLADNTRHMYIARGKSGNLFIFDIEPVKNNINTQWNGRGMKGMLMFNKLFQFVKWEDKEATSIKNILENCEVIKDE